MSQIGLVVKFADLAEILTALTSAQKGLSDQLHAMRGDVDSLLSGWAQDTESRQAQQSFDRRLGEWSEELTAALEAIRTALSTTVEAAHSAEVHNVAIMD